MIRYGFRDNPREQFYIRFVVYDRQPLESSSAVIYNKSTVTFIFTIYRNIEKMPVNGLFTELAHRMRIRKRIRERIQKWLNSLSVRVDIFMESADNFWLHFVLIQCILGLYQIHFFKLGKMESYDP